MQVESRTPSRARGILSLVTAVALFGGLLFVGSPAQSSIPSGTNGLVAVASGGAGAGPIVAVDPATGARTTLLGSVAGDTEPEVAPNGLKVAFVNGGNIFIADWPSGNNRQQITVAGGFSSPAWNPGSTTLVFDNCVGACVPPVGASTGLFTAPATPGSAVTAVTGSVVGDDEPDYSPDGAFIVFDQQTTPGITRLNAAGGSRTGLVNSVLGDDHPRVNPAGNTVVFSCGNFISPSNLGVCTLPWPNGGARTTLAGSAAGDDDPTYSPDGAKVAFGRAGVGIGTINSNGTGGFAALVGTAAADLDPSWSTSSTGTAPVPGNPPPTFSAASSCGGSVMLRIFGLFGPATAGVSASDTAGQIVTLSASGLAGYVGAVATAGNPAVGTLSINLLNPLEYLNLLLAILLQTPSTATITATDNGVPAASSTCSLTVRVGII